MIVQYICCYSEMESKFGEKLENMMNFVKKIDTTRKTILLFSPGSYASILIPFIKGEQFVEDIAENESPYLKRVKQKMQSDVIIDIDLYAEAEEEYQIIRFPIFNSDQINEQEICLTVFMMHLLVKRVPQLNISIGLCYDLIIEHHIYLKFFQFLNQMVSGNSTATIHKAVSLIFMKIQVEDDAGQFITALEDISEEINKKETMIYDSSLEKYCLFTNHLEQDRASFKKSWFQICEFEAFQLSSSWYTQCQQATALIPSINTFIAGEIFHVFSWMQHQIINTLKSITMNQRQEDVRSQFECILETINLVKTIQNEKIENQEGIRTLLEVINKNMSEFNLGIENIRKINIIADAENLLQFITMTKMFEPTPYLLQLQKITIQQPLHPELHSQYTFTEFESLILTTLQETNFDLDSIEISQHLQDTYNELKSKLESLNEYESENNGIMRNYTGDILNENECYDQILLWRFRNKQVYEQRQLRRKLLNIQNPPKPEEKQCQEEEQEKQDKQQNKEKASEEGQEKLALPSLSPEQKRINEIFEIFQNLFKFKDYQACMLILLAFQDFLSIATLLKKKFLLSQAQDDPKYLQSKKKFILSIIIPYLNAQIHKKDIREDVCQCLIRCVNYLETYAINNKAQFLKKQEFLKNLIKKVSEFENKEFKRKKKIVKKKIHKSQFYNFLVQHLKTKATNDKLEVFDHPLIEKSSSQESVSKFRVVDESYLKKIDVERSVDIMKNRRFLSNFKEFLGAFDG